MVFVLANKNCEQNLIVLDWYLYRHKDSLNCGYLPKYSF